MKNSIILTLVMLLCGAAFAQTHPDAEYNLIRRTYKVNGDGSIDYTFRKEIKILRNRALIAYADKGETFIVYNPATESVTINESYTQRKDGSRVVTPANAFVEQLPSECENCGRYNDMRELVVVHTAMEYDCIIVLDYTIHRTNGILNEEFYLREDCPIKKYEVIVDLPDNQTLYRSFSQVQPANMQYVRDYHTYHLVVKEIPQTLNEAYLPANDELYPHLLLSNQEAGTPVLTVGNSAAIPQADKLLRQLRPKGSYSLNDGNEQALQYACAIRDWVIDNIHLNNVHPMHANYRTADGNEVWSSGCGTLIEKNDLLATLLRQAGFTAHVEMGYLNGQQTAEESDVTAPNASSMVRVLAPGSTRVLLDASTNGNPLQYVISAGSKAAPRLKMAACDLMRVNVDTTLAWQPVEYADGYCKMELPHEAGALNINPSLLTPSRTAPLHVRPTEEQTHYIIPLPKGCKMLTKPVEIRYEKEGIGGVLVSVNVRGGRVDITRHLVLEGGTITHEQYADFRQMIIDWNSATELYFKQSTK